MFCDPQNSCPLAQLLASNVYICRIWLYCFPVEYCVLFFLADSHIDQFRSVCLDSCVLSCTSRRTQSLQRQDCSQPWPIDSLTVMLRNELWVCRWVFDIHLNVQGYDFRRAAILKHHRRTLLKSRNFFSHSVGGQKPEIKVLAELVPSEGPEERLCSRWLSLASRWLSSLCAVTSSSLCLCPNFRIRKAVILDQGPPL